MISWEIAWPLGALLLGLAIAWGLWSYHTRNKANDRLTEEATREMYKHPDSYERTEKELRKQVRPS